MTVLGPAEGAARRLNLAQSFNPLGSITGILIGQYFIFSGVELNAVQLGGLDSGARTAYYASQSLAVQGPYLVIGAVACCGRSSSPPCVCPWPQGKAMRHGPHVSRRGSPLVSPAAQH